MPGDGEPSAASDVDRRWRDHEEAAIAVLKTLRDPDAAIAAAAIRSPGNAMIAAEQPVPAGTDPFHEAP